jgi:hypothetical protein
MKDYLHTALNWVDHNRYKFLALAVIALIAVYGVGCESTATSLVSGQQVGQTQFTAESATITSDLEAQRIRLEAEVLAFNEKAKAAAAQIEAGQAEITRKNEIKTQLFELGGSVLTAWATGGVTTPALIGTLVTAGGLLFGIGGYADGKRKDVIIEQAKTDAANS